MSDRPTPETDAAASPHIGFYSCATVTANFARKLERERDEAKAGREAYKQLAVKHAQDRDEAREALTSQNIVIAQHVVITDLMLERDEAREQAHRFRALHYSHLGINGSASWFPWEGHE